MSNGLHVPGRVNIEVNRMNAPMAEQFVIPVQKSNGFDLNVIGGMTKLEVAAIQVSSINIQIGPPAEEWESEGEREERRKAMLVCAAEVVDFAAALLDECRRREETPPG